MAELEQRPPSMSIDFWAIFGALVVAVVMVVLATQAQAQTFQVIHNFTGNDGSQPQAGLTMDRAGNLYGTTRTGGAQDGGTVFKLVPQGSSWILKPLYDFTGGNDGSGPLSRVTFGSDGNLYGTTFYGGDYGLGTVYRLQPPQSACKAVICPWRETVLYSFTGGNDGANPEGDLTFDQAGNLYGVTNAGAGGGCYSGCGVVFQLARAQGSWTLNVLHAFTGGADGGLPASGPAFDNAGNLYGTTVVGGINFGVVYELTPGSSGWSETILHNFASGSDGQYPFAGVVFDASGNLYGVTEGGGGHNNGVAFELQPGDGGWVYGLLYNLGLQSGQALSTLTLDSLGNLYGTAYSGGTRNVGAVYELTSSGESWNYVSLHDFVVSDGASPQSSVLLDSTGNLYGTATYGGSHNDGVIWEITPN